MSFTPNKTLSEILETSKTIDANGNTRTIDDNISATESKILYEMFTKSNATHSIETGLAFGTSALVFTQGHKDKNNDQYPVHFAIDPNQSTDYAKAAYLALEKEGSLNMVEVLEGPSHMEIPKLIEKGVKVQCAFIDGWHTFDYTLIDFFLIDKILEAGGYVAFHDCYGRAKQKVIRYILTHRKYKIDQELMNFRDAGLMKTMKFFVWRILRDPMLFFSKHHWKYQFKHTSGLVVLKKIEDFEPPFSFFENF